MKKSIITLKTSRYMKTVFLIITKLMVSTSAFCQDIYGTVNDETGNAVANADVRLMENDRDVLLGYAVTDGTGMSYKRLQGMKYRHPAGKLNDGLWPDSSVRRILRNEVYIGNMIQGKNTTISFKHKQCRRNQQLYRQRVCPAAGAVHRHPQLH